MHVPVSLLAAAIQHFVYEFVLLRQSWVPRRALSPVELHMNLLTYWAVVGVSHAFYYYNRYRDREVAASRLEAQLAGARLELLRAQLHPHFLFNTLHAISELMHEDVERADLMLTHLSELLRLALENAGAHEVPLREELDFLHRYLEIQQMRFQDRLSVRVEAEPEALDACVPYLILQPLVENAIRHGVATREAPGRVEVRATRRAPGPEDPAFPNGAAHVLRLEVRDDGPGLPAGGAGLREGLGLTNTRVRLRELYGPAQRCEITNIPGGGLCVSLEIPFHEAAARSPHGGSTAS